MGRGSGGNPARRLRWRVCAVIGSPGMRDQVLAAPGALAATMRRVEGLALPEGATAELWQWVEHLLLVRGLRGATTCARYAEVVARFLAYVATQAGWDYRALALPQIDAWLRWLFMARHNSAVWRGQQLRAVRSFYDWRSRMGLGPNCAGAAQGPRAAKRVARKYRRKELRAMVDTVSGSTPLARRDRTVLLFLLCSGARREECANLELRQLELTERRGIVRFVGKGAKEREVSMEGPVLDELRAWLHARDQVPGAPKHQRVWCALSRPAKGKPLGVYGIEGIVKRAARRGGLDEWGVHRFRVTFATQLYDDGTDIERIRAVLGHENIETTRRYLDVSERRRSVRLRSERQHDVLGTRPTGMPRWLHKKLNKGGTDDAAAQ